MNTLAPMNFDRTLILHILDADLMKRERRAPATFVKAPNDSVFDLFFFFFFFSQQYLTTQLCAAFACLIQSYRYKR